MKNEITKDEFWSIQDKWTEITEPNMEDQRRWVTLWTQVLQNPETLEYWDFSWEEVSSESSEGSESDDVSVCQVWPFEVTRIEYRAKKPGRN